MLFEPHADGIIFLVQAHAGARKNAIAGVKDGVLKVSVTQAPEKGKANKAIIAVLSKSLSLRKSQLDIVAGETSRRKRVLARDISSKELSRRIEQALSDI